MKTVKKSTDYRIDTSEKLAGGFGNYVAKQSPEALLRRSVMSCLLWEDLAYESGLDVANNIASLIPKVDPKTCYEIAIEARNVQKLRHVPLYIARIMAQHPEHKKYVGDLLPQIIQRADELAEFVAIYWKDAKQPLSKQVKIGLAKSFNKFNEYQFAKYRGDGKDIKLRDVLQLVHPVPENQNQSSLYKAILDNTLKTPDTWEVALSSGANKKETWERLIMKKKLGALAFMRNLRNMESVGVDPKVISHGFETINPKWLLPLNYLSASRNAPRWEHEIETLMLKSLETNQKLSGYTIFVVDVSGSMNSTVSSKSQYSRLEVAESMAMLASSLCEKISVYVTAGSDWTRTHKTKILAPRKGFAMMDQIESNKGLMGGGGIFTRQCLEYIKEEENGIIPDRIIVFSDSQDCDQSKELPKPFGKYNYIVDVSAHKHGVNYDGIWTAEISGWSEGFIPFIMALEGNNIQEAEEE